MTQASVPATPPLCMDQRRIPGLSRLFADYLYDFARVAGFYGAARPPFSPEALAAAAGAAVADFPVARRSALADCLQAQNLAFGAGPAARENLERLRREDCAVIVAGQQAGLFGGPLLTFLKAITALRLAADLRARGGNAVAVFWLASQDHDLAEVDEAWVLDREGDPLRLSPNASTHQSGGGRPVGREPLGEGVTAALAQWRTQLPPEAANTAAWSDIAAAYVPEATFAAAFGRALARWFAPWGLLLLDPLDPALAALGAAAQRDVIRDHARLEPALAERTRQILAAGYHAQVADPAAASLLFLENEQGRRVALRPAANGRDWRAGDAEMSAAELERWLTARPDRVSPGALARPLLQDWLLPTAAQVTGPAETAYLAQSAALYQTLGRRQPLVFPRLGATLLDARLRRLLEKHQTSVADLWELPASPPPAEALANDWAAKNIPPELARHLEQFGAAAQQGLARLTEDLAALDPTLVDFVQTAGAKIQHQSEQIEARVRRALARRNADVTRQARLAAGAVFPGRHLQERVLAGADFLLRAPAEAPLLERLFAELRPFCPDHQIVAI